MIDLKSLQIRLELQRSLLPRFDLLVSVRPPATGCSAGSLHGQIRCSLLARPLRPLGIRFRAKLPSWCRMPRNWRSARVEIPSSGTGQSRGMRCQGPAAAPESVLRGHEPQRGRAADSSGERDENAALQVAAVNGELDRPLAAAA